MRDELADGVAVADEGGGLMLMNKIEPQDPRMCSRSFTFAFRIWRYKFPAWGLTAIAGGSSIDLALAHCCALVLPFAYARLHWDGDRPYECRCRRYLEFGRCSNGPTPHKWTFHWCRSTIWPRRLVLTDEVDA